MRHRIPLVLVTVTLLLLAGLPAQAEAAGSWTWPVRGEVITAYRNGADPYAGGQHRGVDLASPVGTRVVAAVGGTVRFAGVAGSSGLTVSIRTGDGRFDTSYLHLATTTVREGDRVSAGQRVGAVGTSGRRSSSRPHLHFGVREAGSRHAYRNPLHFLAPLPGPPAPEAPRGVPVPVGTPVGPAPAPAPVARPAPARRRGRVPERRPLRAPVPAERRVRVPAGRRVRAPGVGRLPGRSPTSVPTVPLAPRRAPDATRSPDRVREPERGPGGDRVAAPAAPTRDPAGNPADRAERAGEGPDLGWAIACVGLLLAAACIGGSSRGGSTGSWRAALRVSMRPHVGRR